MASTMAMTGAPGGPGSPTGSYNYRGQSFNTGAPGASCCGGDDKGPLAYVGPGGGRYVLEPAYRFVGVGGDHDVPRPRWTVRMCLPYFIPFAICCLLPALLCWWWVSEQDSYNCSIDFDTYDISWSLDKAEYCCERRGRGCDYEEINVRAQEESEQPVQEIHLPPPTPPATNAPPAANLPPADPYNCAIGTEQQWPAPKLAWCCQHHPQRLTKCGGGAQPQPAQPADPYNCAEGFANWHLGWSVSKKTWCCSVHGKACENGQQPAKPFDCVAGLANWNQGWSAPKKAWCCNNEGKGCPNGR